MDEKNLEWKFHESKSIYKAYLEYLKVDTLIIYCYIVYHTKFSALRC